MADLQGGVPAYSHFVHVHGQQYQQSTQQRQQAQQHPNPLPAGARGRDRPPRGSGGGANSGGHQRRPSRDSDADSSTSEQQTAPGSMSQPQQPNGILVNGDAMGVAAATGSGSGGTPKAGQRPPPPPGFGAAPQAGGPPRQPPPNPTTAAVQAPHPQQQHHQQQLAVGTAPTRPPMAPVGPLVKPGGAGAVASSASTATVLSAALVNGIGGSSSILAGSSTVTSSTQQQQQAPAGSSSGGSGAGGGSAAGGGVASSTSGGSGGGGSQSTHLNPAAPPFRSLHGGSLEQVEGSLLAQADANGLKETLSKLRGLMRQRDAIDTRLISEASGLVSEAERLAEVREQQRLQQAAFDDARARVETTSLQLADRDNQITSMRRQMEDKDGTIRAKEAQIRKLESDLAEARRRTSSLERDVAAAAQRADTTAAKMASVEQELNALREAYKAQSESRVMEQQQQQQQQQHAAHQHQQHQQHQQQQVVDGWHQPKGPHMGPMGQPLHQMAGAAPPPDGAAGPHFGAMSLAGLGGAGLKGAPPPPPGGFQMQPPPLPLFNPLPTGPGGLDAAAAAAQMAGYLDAAAAGNAAGLFGGERFLPPPHPPGMPLPPGFHLPPHPHVPPPPHPMAGHFGAPPPLPGPEELQAKILDLLSSDPADAVQWDERMDAALDAALAPLQWGRDLAHVYGSPRNFMMAHPELFAQRQDGAVYRAPRVGNSSSGGGTAGAGNVGGRLMGMPPPPPGMAPHAPPHGPGPFGVMPGLTAAGIMFGSSHY